MVQTVPTVNCRCGSLQHHWYWGGYGTKCWVGPDPSLIAWVKAQSQPDILPNVAVSSKKSVVQAMATLGSSQKEVDHGWQEQEKGHSHYYVPYKYYVPPLSSLLF